MKRLILILIPILLFIGCTTKKYITEKYYTTNEYYTVTSGRFPLLINKIDYSDGSYRMNYNVIDTVTNDTVDHWSNYWNKTYETPDVIYNGR